MNTNLNYGKGVFRSEIKNVAAPLTIFKQPFCRDGFYDIFQNENINMIAKVSEAKMSFYLLFIFAELQIFENKQARNSFKF